uniref:Myosin heavy chain-related protein n=1 Tax=Tanacetum cinerariifolium TaxID=118510 RepID=A0A6L2JAG9_TANCI|nr:myosin heavy chain-related protein [Tanacetum cinerariifolium]
MIKRSKTLKMKKSKNVEDQQVSERTINETSDTITSLQSEVASFETKGSLDANEEIKKAHTRVHELEKQMKKHLMELQLYNHFKEALETRSKGLEKKRLNLNPTLHDFQKVTVAQKKKTVKAEIQRRI